MTLFGMGVTLAVCAVLCVGLYIGVSVSLHHEVDQFLVGEVHEFFAILTEEKDEDLREIERDIRQEIGSRALQDLTFRLLNASGVVQITSDPNEQLPDPWPNLEETGELGGEVWFQTIDYSKNNPPLRCCSQWVELAGRGTYVVQATYRLGGVRESLASFRRMCYGAMAVAAILSSLGGWLLSRRLLRPVHQMTVAAQQIGAKNLSRRLVRSENKDELDHLAAVLNEMLERLESQFKQIQQFTADAAHELRTPLAALRGNAELALHRADSDPEWRDVLAASIDEYDRLSCIADDLLLLAQADTGNSFLRFERFSMRSAVRDVSDLYEPLAQQKDISLDIEDVAASEFLADGGRVRQVIGNLLDNAIRHTPRGGVIRINTVESNGHVELTVSDSGPGIPAGDLPHIFDRFYRADTARTRRGGGAGLGLAICRTIVEGHGGSIEAKCDADGTSFTFRIAKAHNSHD